MGGVVDGRMVCGREWMEGWFGGDDEAMVLTWDGVG